MFCRLLSIDTFFLIIYALITDYELRIKMLIKTFEELPIWKLSLKITKEIYDITFTGKFARDFGLRDQLRRAVVSISSNIVEGFEKNNNNEFVRFLRIAKGSVGEVRNQLYIALAISYITNDEFKKLNSELQELGRQIDGFIYYLIKKKTDKVFLSHKLSNP